MNFAEVGEYPETGMDQGLNLDIVRPQFQDYRAEANRLLMKAKGLLVQDQESLNHAVAIGGSAKKAAKAIDAQRRALILKPSEFVKGVNGLCNMITDSLDEAERITKQKIGTHQAKVELERREAERKAREATEALQRKLQAEADEANRKAQEEARKRVEEEMRIKREKEASEAKERGARRAELAALEKKAEEERQTALKQAEEQAAKIAVVAPVVVAPVVAEAPKITRTEAGSASQRKNWDFEVLDSSRVPREYLMVDEKKVRDSVRMGTRSIDGIRIYEKTSTVFRT